VPKVNVLLVDDEIEFISALAERLRLRNYDARAVSRAEDVLSTIQHDPPDVVLLDFKMPGMDGIEILKLIKSMHPAVEVIMVTGHGDSKSREEVMNSGAADYIMKPIDIGELVLKINKSKMKNS